MNVERVSRRASLKLLLGALSTAGLPRAVARPAVGRWDDVETVASELIARRAAPGLSISVLREGRWIFSQGFGFANLEAQTAMTPRSICLVGSITKQFTAAALLLLAEAGKLSVDDPLAKFFPDFPRGREISLRQLLTHTAGLGDYSTPYDEFLLQARLEYDSDALYKRMTAIEPLFIHPPGTVYDYNNAAYVLLGLVVQKLAGCPLDVALREGVIRRAGLADTALDDAAEVVPNRASGYSQRNKDASRWLNASYFSRSFAGGAGALRSTSEDLCRWHEALLAGRVMTSASLTDMISPNRIDGELPKEAAKPGMKSAPGLARYGFGIEIGAVNGEGTIGHHGHITGFSSTLLTVPARNISIAILANCDFDPVPESTIRDAVVAAALRTNR